MLTDKTAPYPDNGTISMSYTAWVARILGLGESDLGDLLAGTELDPGSVYDESILMSSQQLVRVIENALAITPEPSFGLALGQLLTPPTHGSLGYLALSSPNLRAAMLAFADFAHLRLGVFNMTVVESSRCLSLEIEVNMAVSEPVYRCLTEGAVVSIQSVAEYIVGRAITEACVEFNFADPKVDYNDYLHTQIRFDAPKTCLKFPIEMADITNITANHASYLLAIEQCRQQLEDLELLPKTMTTRVKKIMLSCPPGQASEAQIAATLFVSKRTLGRRLAKEKTSYRTIREEHLALLAEQYLMETPLSVEAIANLLNYHDSSSFRRAFKKWCGMTPQQFRSSGKARVSTN